MNIGDKIAKARKMQNITQEQLADLMNVTRQAVSRWESNLTYPEMDKFVKLSEILKVNCDYLLKDDVQESGEKIVMVEVVNKDVGLFKKLNWKFIYAICELLFGLYIIGFICIFTYFKRSFLVSMEIVPILAIIFGYVIGITLIAFGLVVLAKSIKVKEFFIKSKYKQ